MPVSEEDTRSKQELGFSHGYLMQTSTVLECFRAIVKSMFFVFCRPPEERVYRGRLRQPQMTWYKQHCLKGPTGTDLEVDSCTAT